MGKATSCYCGYAHVDKRFAYTFQKEKSYPEPIYTGSYATPLKSLEAKLTLNGSL